MPCCTLQPCNAKHYTHEGVLLENMRYIYNCTAGILPSQICLFALTSRHIVLYLRTRDGAYGKQLIECWSARAKGSRKDLRPAAQQTAWNLKR